MVWKHKISSYCVLYKEGPLAFSLLNDKYEYKNWAEKQGFYCNFDLGFKTKTIKGMPFK